MKVKNKEAEVHRQVIKVSFVPIKLNTGQNRINKNSKW